MQSKELFGIEQAFIKIFHTDTELQCIRGNSQLYKAVKAFQLIITGSQPTHILRPRLLQRMFTHDSFTTAHTP